MCVQPPPNLRHAHGMHTHTHSRARSHRTHTTHIAAPPPQASRGLTLDDFKAMLGSPVPRKRTAPVSARAAAAAPPPKPPTSFDARVQWPNCPTIGSIQDQGACGSCWAVAAAEAFSDRACIGSNGSFTAQLSALKLLACDKACGPVGCDSGCQGGFPGDAWKYMVTAGLPTKDCVPYTIAPCHHPCGDNTTTPECPADSCANGGSYAVVKASTSYPFFSEKEVMADIVKNGPVECGMSVYSDVSSRTHPDPSRARKNAPRINTRTPNPNSTWTLTKTVPRVQERDLQAHHRHAAGRPCHQNYWLGRGQFN